MSRQVELEITIETDGKVQVETKGIKGPRCMDVKKAFARFLGRVLREEKTGEYYEAERSGLRQLFRRQKKP